MSEGSVASREPVFVGIDLGGTKILGLLADAEATIGARVRQTTPTGGNGAILTAVQAVVRDLVDVAHAHGHAVGGIAICAPGFITADGRVLDASNLDIRDLPLQALIAQTLNLPTLVLHDVAAAALGETRFGAARGASHVLFCSIGTGIGGGFVVDGRIYRGAAGRAGEIGHVCVQPGGPLCTCGKRGCLEALASGMALVAQAHDALQRGALTALADLVDGDPARLRVELIAQAAHEGDALATELLRAAAERIGATIADLIHVLDLDCVVLGGGVARSGELFLGPLRATVRERVFDVYQDVALPVSALAADAGALGAIAALRDRAEEPL
jgi:glucokinase